MNLNYFNIPSSERLRYREVSLEDQPAWLPFFKDEITLRFLPINAHLEPVERCEQWIIKQRMRYEKGSYGLLGLADIDNRLVGMAGLLRQELDTGTAIEIGYHLLPEFRGKGYASEAAIHLRNWGFENGVAEEIISIILPGNTPSEKVAVKNGMKKEGKAIFHGLEVNIWKITKEKWRTVNG